MGLSVRVSNVSARASVRDIHELFSFAGTITAIWLQPPGDGGSTEAYVTFSDDKAVETALLLSESAIRGTIVTVEAAPSEYEAPPNARRYAVPGGEAEVEGSPLKQAEAMVRRLVEQGFTLGKETAQRARDFDTRHALTRTATAKAMELRQSASAAAADLDKRLRLSQTFSASSERVSQALSSVDAKLRVGEAARGVMAQAEAKFQQAGELIAQSALVASTREWVASTTARVSDLVDGRGEAQALEASHQAAHAAAAARSDSLLEGEDGAAPARVVDGTDALPSAHVHPLSLSPSPLAASAVAATDAEGRQAGAQPGDTAAAGVAAAASPAAARPVDDLASSPAAQTLTKAASAQRQEDDDTPVF